MAFTIGVILTAPIAFSFQRWGFEVVGKNNAKDIIQINATVIVGALFFLNLSPQAKPGFDIDTGLLINALTALSIIPFAFYAILTAIWGGQRFWEQKGRKLNVYGITGVKLGTTFMIAGFIWIIITMITLVTLRALQIIG
jgi:hypothetical protein